VINFAFPVLETTPLLHDLVVKGAPVAIGASGGGDSDVTGFEVMRYLDSVGHSGPRLLIHSDLGRVEWRNSLPQCERLAHRLGVELVVVRRGAGDLMDRWLQRWRKSCERYAALECVKVILPWSTPKMRFCTSELKTDLICRYLVGRFPGQTIISAAGLRRDESPNRAKSPTLAVQTKLTSKTHETNGYNWHPLLAWTKQQVFDYHTFVDFPLHPAYTQYQTTRVSCCFCILGSLHDLIASATCPENHDIYREMVDLEIASSFSFQSGQWLGDVAPHLLDSHQIAGLKLAKWRAAHRDSIEQQIPDHLLYEKNVWPKVMPTRAEAVLLGKIRQRVAEIMQFSIQYTDPDEILSRYEELMAEKVRKGIVVKPTRVLPVQQNLWSLEEVVAI
jgi:3'-phosphoadenosine 5'-phosphosulfate sulfotransferase (PAPS reductase)/FAD synthetase